MSDIFQIIVGTAGHIDHGKSSLVRKLTNIDPDRLKEEKERGLTIDLGFAPLVLPSGQKVGIVDVPGHEKFIKNMVAGASGIDFVILVIAADDGVMPQTREHLEIMQLLQLRSGMVALTKVDLVDEELVELAQEEIQDFLAGTFLENAPICPLSTITGTGFPEFQKILHQEISQISPHSTDGPFRMPIQRIFSSHGYGTVVTGIPISGQIKVGEEVEILPQNFSGRVRKIQAYGEDIDLAQAGHSTALNLKDVDYKKVCRGQVAAVPGYFTAARFIQAKFTYSSHIKRPLTHLTPIRFHTGTVEEMGKIAILGEEEVEPGKEAYVQIRLVSPVIAIPGDFFVVRLSSPMITIGGGVILECGERKWKRFRSGIIPSLQKMEKSLTGKEERLEFLLENAPEKICKEDDWRRRSFLSPEVFSKTAQELVQTKRAISLGISPVRYVHPKVLEQNKIDLILQIKEFFRKNPYKKNISKLSLKNLLSWDGNFLDFILETLYSQDKLKKEEDNISLVGHDVQLSSTEKEIFQKIIELYEKAAFTPPLFSEVEEKCAPLSSSWKELFYFVEESKKIIKVSPELYFANSVLEKAKQILVEQIQAKGELASADYRDELKTTRKYVIPLLEYFDKMGITIRRGNFRILKKEKN